MNLIYFTLGGNKDYINLAKICINSLYNVGYDGDFLFITSFKNDLLNAIDFRKEPLFLNVEYSSLLQTSCNKFKLHLFEDIEKYDKIIMSDLDIVWLKNPEIIFSVINEDIFYVSNENEHNSGTMWLMSNDFFGGKILDNEEKHYINTNNIGGINCGLIAFNRNMISRIKQIDNFIESNIELAEGCLDQPFFNVYVHRNDIYNTSSLNDIICHKGYSLPDYNWVAVHFPGTPGNYGMKLDRMKSYSEGIKNG
jgi:hypothetical protein